MDKQSRDNTISESYQEHMAKEHDGSNWGSTGAKYSGDDVAELVRSRPYIQTALDYGCGKGSLAKAIMGPFWTEYDPGIPGKDTKPEGQFDLVTCTDVLEHVELEVIDNVLLDLAEYTGKVLFLDIACYPTGKLFGEGPYIGQDLHILIRPPEWWKDRASKFGLHLAEFKAETKFSKGAYRERCVLTYERV